MSKLLTRNQCMALCRGDEKALRAVFELYNKELIYFAQAIIHSEPDATEIVSDSFFKLWQRRRQYEHPETIRAFLYVTVKNACINFLRSQERASQKKQELLLHITPSDEYARLQEMEAELLQLIYRSASAILPHKCRRIFLLYYKEGLPKQVIARQMGITIKTVCNHLSKAKQLMKNNYALH